MAFKEGSLMKLLFKKIRLVSEISERLIFIKLRNEGIIYKEKLRMTFCKEARLLKFSLMSLNVSVVTTLLIVSIAKLCRNFFLL